MLQFFNFFKPKNLIKQPVPDRKIDRSKDIIKWQTDRSRDNDFPQQLLQNVENSTTGSAAMDVWQEFIQGNGLLDKAAGELEMNKEQTLNDLHALLSGDLSSMEGVAFNIKYDSEGNPKERFHLPFEETRLGEPDKDTDNIKRIFHNPYYGTRDFKDKDTRWYYDYNPDRAHVKREMEAHILEFNKKADPPYPGQAYWFSIEKPLARVYPKPFYYSAINWFQVDAEIPLFHERNIKNNLMPSVLINMHGDPSAPAGPPADNKDSTDKTLDQGETVGDELNAQMKSFQNEKGGVFVNWFLKDEEKATFEAFPTNSHAEEWIALQEKTDDKISIGTKVPRILLNIATAGKLGDTQEVLNAIRMMQGRTRRKRNILKTIYEKVMRVPDGTIKNINPIDIIPDMVWGALTLEEQRSYIKENFNLEIEVNEDPQADPVKIELDPSQNGR